MTDISRLVELYNVPIVDRETPVPTQLGIPFTTISGSVVKGGTAETLEFGLRAGAAIQQNSAPGVEVQTTLKEILLTIENTNRSVGNTSDLAFTVLLPTHPTVAASPYFGNVNAWIADEIAATGLTEMKTLAGEGWAISYRGNELEGNLRVVVNGDFADDVGAPMNVADDNTVLTMPPGQWFVRVCLIAWDGVDNYYWGDPDGVFDLVVGQDETDYDGGGDNGTFAGGFNHANANSLTLSDGTVITVDLVTVASSGCQVVDVGSARVGGDATGLAADTAGLQVVDLGGTPGGGASTGLAADTAGTQTVDVGGTRVGGDVTGLAADTAGAQAVDFGGAVTGGTATGLDSGDTPGFADATNGSLIGTQVTAAGAATYDFDVTIDGGPPQLLTVTLSGGETYSAIAALMSTAVTGGSVAYDDPGFAFRVTSATTGTSSAATIAVGTLGSGGGDLFAALDAAETVTHTFPAATAGTTSTFTATVNPDGGGAQPLSVDGENAATFTALIVELDLDTTGASWSIIGGDLVCTSDTTGTSSSIAIIDTDLFAGITGFSSVLGAVAGTTTVYTATMNVDAGGEGPISIVGDAAQTYTALISELDADSTGATWSLIGGDLVATSDSTGVSSSIDIGDTNLFSSLATFSSIAVAVAGTTTVYTATVNPDAGGAQPISIVGEDAQIFSDLLTELDTDTTGASWSLAGGGLTCTSDTTGVSSSIALVDTDLFSTLTGFSSILSGVIGTTTVYTATIAVDGEGPQALSVVGDDAQTYTTLLSELDLDTINASWALNGGDVKATSNTTGAGSSILIADTNLFSSLSDFSSILAAVAGIAGGIVLEFTVASSGSGESIGVLTQTGTDGSGFSFSLTTGLNNLAPGPVDVIRQLKYFVPEQRDLSCDGRNQDVMVVARGADTTDGLDYAASYADLGPEGAVIMDGEQLDNGVIGGVPAFTGDAAVARATSTDINPHNLKVSAIVVKALRGQTHAVVTSTPTFTGMQGQTVIVDPPGGPQEICVWSDDAAAWVCATLSV